MLVDTDDGTYGTDISFAPGLNVIRAPNTSGKSTCIQAIIYALGLEGMLGPASSVPLPHAMTHWLEDPSTGAIHQVLQSQVMLEIVDDYGRPLSIRRYVVHPEIDRNLVSVWNTTIADVAAGSSLQHDYFVRRPGAATRDAGYHRFLAERFGWDLPDVARFDGRSGPLYLEVVAPLFIVEQKRGWSGIQAQTPTQFQIKDVRKRAIEFVLELDVQERARRILELEARASKLVVDWQSRSELLNLTATQAGAVVHGLPAKPSLEWPLEVAPEIRIAIEAGWRTLEEELLRLNEVSSRELHVAIPDSGTDAPSVERQLGQMQDQLARTEIAVARNHQQLELEQSTLDDTRARLAALEDDIRRHQDLITLSRMGSDVAQEILFEDCPVCHRMLDGIVLSPEDSPPILGVDESLAALAGRRELFQSVLANAERIVSSRKARASALSRVSGDLRTEIRTLKDTLTSPSLTPSAAVIEARLQSRRALEELRALELEFTGAIEELGVLSSDWVVISAELSDLRQAEFSESDRSKLQRLELLFRAQLEAYGFESCPVSQLGLAIDNYMPTHEGFDLTLDWSASDGIRVIWAYLIGLLELSAEANTNHPGLVVFDEPKQQAAADFSFKALLSESSTAALAAGGQVLFATSEPEDTLQSMLDHTEANVVTFDSKILKRR